MRVLNYGTSIPTERTEAPELFRVTNQDSIYPTTITQTRTKFDEKNNVPSIIHHPIDRKNDTLMRLSLMYNVEIADIKAANGIYSPDDDLSFFQEETIIIPGPNYFDLKKLFEDDFESTKRDLMNKFITMKQVNEDVANYYLSTNQLNFKKSIQHYDDDIAWEKKDNQMKNKRQIELMREEQKLKKQREGVEFFGFMDQLMKPIFGLK
eukprot:gene7135-11448_t